MLTALKSFGNKIYSYMQKPKNIFTIGCFIGAIIFVCIYGIKILNFAYTDWLICNNGGDTFQHYIGFSFFRNEPWHFPIGIFDTYSYPDGNSIVYTDSIPIFALFFKLINFILPENFQYFGLWGIMSFALMGGLSSLIMRKYTDKAISIIIASIFFALSTNVIWRMYGHSALAGQWVLLLSILAWCHRDRLKKTSQKLLVWTFICCLSVLIHPYFLLMNIVMMMSYLIYDYIENKCLLKSLLVLIGVLAITLTVFWCIGGFYVHSYSAGGLGIYSMNLNALINPQSWSYFLKDLNTVGTGQYEGFQYLGLGILFLIPMVIYIYMNKKIEFKKLKLSLIIPVAFFIFSLTFLSVSPKVTLNGRILFDYSGINIAEKVWGIFRATGRLFWPVFYAIQFFIFISLIKNANRQKISAIILCFCVFFQIADLSKILISKSNTFNQQVIYTSPLQSGFWDQIKNDIEHIELLSENIQYEPFAVFASENNLTLNYGYFARNNETMLERMKKEMDEIYIQGTKAIKTIYILPRYTILNSEYYQEIEVDGYSIVLSSDMIQKAEEYLGDSYKPLNGFYVDLNDPHYINCELLNGSRIMKPEGISFGPYAHLSEGEYLITVEGENLSSIEFDYCMNTGEDVLDNMENIIISNNEIKYTIKLDKHVDDMEIRFYNHTDKDITLNSVNVTKIK